MTLIGSNEKDELSHFIRQRRNLVLISLFIIFYKVGNLELTTVNFLGNQTKIGNPEVITFCLSVFFSYFLWRYYTACREIGGISRFLMRCTDWAENKARDYIQRKEFGKKKVYSNQIQLIGREKGARIYRVFDNKSEPLNQGREVKTRYYYSLMKTISVIPTIFKTSTFSEYILPYVIAAIAIIEFAGLGITEQLMVFFSGLIEPIEIGDIKQTSAVTLNSAKEVTSSLVTENQNISSCVYKLWDMCFVKPTPASRDVSIFGFAEFITALALLVIVYTFSDIRYKFRINIAPFPLYKTTYIGITFIGLMTLLIDVWSASQWPILEIGISKHILQGFLGFLFLLLALIWIFFAFIKPPVFNKLNAKRYSNRLLNIIMEGSEAELPIIAHELGRSAKNIVKIARRAPSRTQTKEENQEAQPSMPPKAEDYAYEILLMIGTRRLCRYIVSSAPITAMEFFRCFSESLRYKSLPVGQFVRNVSTEAILNKDCLFYHEDEGYNSGWLGYVRPFSEAIYGDYSLINMLSNDGNASPLDIDYKTAWKLDVNQLQGYCRATLITLEAYIKDHPRGATRSYALNQAFEYIQRGAGNIYKLDGLTDYYPTEEYSKLNVVVHFIKDAIRILNKYGTPEGRLKTYPEYGNKDIYDQIADMMFETILDASSVKSPRDTCWSIHYNAVWSDLFSFSNEGAAQKIIYFRLRRLLYDEICRLNEFPNYKSAGILAICLNVLGPVIPKRGITVDREHRALHVVMVAWLKKNYVALQEKQPDVANACIIGSITYEKDKKRIVKSYIKGLRLEEPKEYLELKEKKKKKHDKKRKTK